MHIFSFLYNTERILTLFVSKDLIYKPYRVINVLRGYNMKENIYQKRILEWTKKYGGLSKDVQRKIDKLVLEYDKKKNISKDNKILKITKGTKLVREFNGKQYSVIVTNRGYEYNSKIYKSLSAIANEITGTHWNGKKFFGVN